MFEYNGYMYGGKLDEPLKVIQVKTLPDMMMIIQFNNGESRLFDATILRGEVFSALYEQTCFEKCEIDHGVVTWCDGEVDCAPEFMYEHSFEYVHSV